jgi:secernin
MCDTIVATPETTIDATMILAKNSDRDPDEVQLVHFIPPATHKDTKLKCTWISIPQVRKTSGVLISRPFWMWGGEMGANDHGLAIGNEAVFTREPHEKTGLTGMDLLRLALERCASAPAALECITDLLKVHGQGGNCGYRQRMVYHNSFIIADKKEAWILETAGRYWAARRVKGTGSISNGLTIGEEYDLCSHGLEDYARRKGYLKKHASFSFRDSFSDTFYTFFSKCSRRQARTADLLSRKPGMTGTRTMMSILRDHGSDEDTPPPHMTDMGTVCMHAAFGPLRASQSTSAFVAHLRGDIPVYWMTAGSGTCTGTYKPLYLNGGGPDFLPGESSPEYAADIPWWRHEVLHRLALMRYGSWHPSLSAERDRLEEAFIKDEKKLYASVRRGGKTAAGKLNDFSKGCFAVSRSEEEKWIDLLREAGPDSGIPMLYRYFWRGRNRRVKLPQ